MPMDTKEKRFESDIESYLLSKGGYVKGDLSTYDKKRAIDMPVLISFLEKTQPKMWEKYQKVYGDKAEHQLYLIFQNNVAKYGLIHVLRNGVKDRGMSIRFCYFAPAAPINNDLVEKYNSNILTETRQFAYSTENHNTIDMVLSLNGIPVVALELKDQITGQSVKDAIHQFKHDRDPKELIFNFNSRILAYFAVDLYEVAMTTELKQEATHFLPFNQGSNGAGRIGDGGNPANPEGYMTSYLWEKVLNREMLLSILQRYISKQVEETIKLEKGKQVKETSTKIIFPRYHQLDVVEKLIADTRANGAGHNYLLQHSAGSGKSNSIAWLCYRLASLHNAEDKDIFQTVFVITDRRVLNRQLQDTILGFDHMEGQIEKITDKDNSSKLKDAINDGKRIIITTLHRFPIIYKELDNHKGKNFAIIVDEAHSSQSGKSAEKLKAALADTDEALREYAEEEGKTEEQVKDEMDTMLEVLSTQGRHANLSFFAFTATPKPKTLETFGIMQSDGSFDAFHHYSMRQAIDEGFIMDVLKFYTTYGTAYEIAKTISSDPTYEEPPATRAIKAYHDNHERVIEQITAIIVEKFRDVTLTKINGKAKAMVVCPSRAHAVRYYFAIKDYCLKQGYKNVSPLVAFSGEVTYQGVAYTEPMLNSSGDLKISEGALPMYFASDLYNILIVADKYQTGFDEPLLHTMFILKKLKGVKAVQTLSRVNRYRRGKVDTYILDFANSADEIEASFKPFFEDTLLGEGVDINKVYEYKTDIDAFHMWNQQDEDKLYAIYSKEHQTDTDLGKIRSILQNSLNIYKELTEENQFLVRSLVKNFIRFYAYMAQIVRTWDKELYKSYIYAEFLYKALPKNAHESVDLTGKISLVNSKFDETFSGSISLAPTQEDKTLEPEKGSVGKPAEENVDLLTNIIDKVNIMYRGQFNEADRVIIETIYDKMQHSTKSLKKQALQNSAEMFEKSIFPKFFAKVAEDCYVEQMESFSKLFENQEFFDRVMAEMGKAMYANLRNE